jgi:ATP-dependent helicase/nuclease subunit A
VIAKDTALKKQENVRHIDPDVLQRTASDPEASVWVSASAGTGKTKVLTDRVLRLMLPRDDGRAGTPAHKILCLTFTKAAASEMALRVSKALSNWAIMPEKELQESLRDLLGHNPSEAQTAAARRLFADVIDTPGGLKIMTLHSFCQSVLSRFPLEAGLSPSFEVLQEDESSALLGAARDRILTQSDSEEPLRHALQRLGQTLNEEQFLSLLNALAAERRQLGQVLKFGTDALYTQICRDLGIQPGQESEDILKHACREDVFDMQGLRAACRALAQGPGADEGRYAALMQNWLDAPVSQRQQDFKIYRDVFLTGKNEPRVKGFPTASTKKAFPDCENILRTEAARLLALDEAVNAAACASLTRDLFLLGSKILATYKDMKTRRTALDFDDLILKTLELLSDTSLQNMAGWVHYKLDQGIDHVLIDEAQDTNPEQWAIIDRLCDEFFSGSGAREETRTLFTVGDEKQSIYSFQRAAPEEFTHMKNYFAQKIKAAKQKFEPVALNISFRSAPAILQTVDAIFTPETMREGLGEADIRHISFRRKQAGLAELWPICETEETTEADPWAPPVTIVEIRSGAVKLADRIAHTIKNWIGHEQLPSHDRTVQPGDILILVRRRTSFVAQLTRALKRHNIPVSGVDRMILTEQLAVMDLLAFAQFALLPTDDLSLACILKSPIIGLSEDDLFNIAHARKTLLWEALKQSTYKDIAAYLAELIKLAASAHPYEFFSYILQCPCPADQISGLRGIRARLGEDALDPLDELLNAALDFERRHIPSLQKFLHAQEREERQIKREMEEAGNKVRIMTVHGAKGLQAPIVILPDTMARPRKGGGKPGQRLLWPAQTKLNVPLWAPNKNYECALYRDALRKIEEREERESHRLLYVAMTRAENRLYIAGYTGKQSSNANSWYDAVKIGLQSLPDIEAMEDGTLRFTNPQDGAPDRPQKMASKEGQQTPPPSWLHEPAAPEPVPSRPLVPSRPSEEDQPSLSPLISENGQRFRRGNVTHKLLQILPSIAVAKHDSTMNSFLQRHATDLSADIHGGIKKEIKAILDHPQYAPLFGPGSLAEAPISGLLPDGRLISGQIDRVLITKDEILIIDYKTNRPPPEHIKDVPQLYKNQLRAYADTLKTLYPKRRIRAALLWTDSAKLMSLIDEQA